MKTLGLHSPESPSARAKREAMDDWNEDDLLVGGASEAGSGGGAVVDGSSSSSEEEPLAAVVERTSPKRRRRRSSVQSDSELYIVEPSPVAAGQASPASYDPPGLPDYASLAVTTLQRKVRQYGFRASKEKDVLVAQLRQVWNAMHPVGHDSAGPAPAAAKTQTAGRTKAASRRKKKADAGTDAEDVEEVAAADTVPGETVGEKLRALIAANDQLYLRILRYEVRWSANLTVLYSPLTLSVLRLQPVHIDEFATLAADNGVKIARPLLTRFLDEQVQLSWLESGGA